MAMTIEQWKKKQAQLKNGWRYDVDCYRQDQVKKSIKLDNGEVVLCTIRFTEEFDKTVWKYTEMKLVEVNLSLWTPSASGMMTSCGLGKTFECPEKYSKKLFKYLVAESEKITDEFILENAKTNEKKLRCDWVI